VIDVRQLTYSAADGASVLKDISFRVEPRTIVALMGPSGSGKSTLLRTLNRLNEPPPGCVWLRGRDITAIPVWRCAGRWAWFFKARPCSMAASPLICAMGRHCCASA
jgi:ABC-type cobalamin/Fe3+-siderophores transport system ATPase subunit